MADLTVILSSLVSFEITRIVGIVCAQVDFVSVFDKIAFHGIFSS